MPRSAATTSEPWSNRFNGREFDTRDRLGAPRTAIVNETFARRYFPDSSAPGRIFQLEVGPGEAEIGIRVALGGDPRAVIRMMLTESTVLLGIGLAQGVCRWRFLRRDTRKRCSMA